MKRWLGRHENIAYTLIRLVSGLLLACHGAQKLLGVLGVKAAVHDPLMILAGIIEFGGGLAIATGLQASFVAFVASGELAVAYFKVHFPRGFWPILNGGELAVLYSFLFLYIATRGSGTWSLDYLLERWFDRHHQRA
jgi:putative oxidoreductase